MDLPDIEFNPTALVLSLLFWGIMVAMLFMVKSMAAVPLFPRIIASVVGLPLIYFFVNFQLER